MPDVSLAEATKIAELPLSFAAKGLLMVLWSDRDVADLNGLDVASSFPRRLREEVEQSKQRGDEAMDAYTELHKAGYLIDTPDPRWGNSVVITLDPKQ